MRCLEALGQWGELNNLGKKAFAQVCATTNASRRQNMAITAARGSWAIGKPFSETCAQRNMAFSYFFSNF